MERHVRLSKLLVLPLFLYSVVAFASDRPQNWLQVTSQHFTVFSDGNDKQARHIADQFERMRLVFHTGFPDMQVDPDLPIMVIAVKDNKDFRALEPEAYLAKGQLELAGLFLRTPDKNYVLLRMDAGGEHPYATIYHEYTHLLFSKAGDWLPLWLNEGLAQFYENTYMGDKETILGEPNPDDIYWLQHNRIIPLTTLFTVDQRSPYYHEEHKGSIFYAESWALTDYLQVTEAEHGTHQIRDYAVLLSNHVDPLTAATRAFGDLNRLQLSLESYIRQSNFKAFKLANAFDADETNFKVQPVTATQADAIRADFLAYNGREKDARTLLDQVLKADAGNILAHETMGHLEYQAGNMEQAENWYQQAVKLDSQSFLANYYFASIAMNREKSGDDMDAQIEGSLQRAIKLNPAFAQSYDRLAAFYALQRHKNFDQARLLSLQAIQRDPGNVYYRVNCANILLTMQHESDAITVLQVAMKLAKNPSEVAIVQNALDSAQQFQSARQQQQEQASRFHDQMEASAKSSDAGSVSDAPPKLEREIVLKGPRRSITGTIKNVRCSSPSVMDLEVDAAPRKLTLHSSDYYKIEFTALGFTPQSELNPCTDLEGAHAKLEYIESTEAKINGVVAIELHK